MSVSCVKKATKKKEPVKKECSKQLKIVSFFSSSGNCVSSKTNGRNGQSKISKYFSVSNNDVQSKENENELSGKKTISKIDSEDNIKFDEIDLTGDDDELDNVKKPLSPVVNNIVNQTKNKDITNVVKTGKDIVSVNVKKSEKENTSIKNNIKTPVKIFNGIKDPYEDVDGSPDIITPTPPKNLSISKHKGTKLIRRFDFSNMGISFKKRAKINSDDCEKSNELITETNKVNLHSEDLKLTTFAEKSEEMGQNNAKYLSKDDPKIIDIEDISDKSNFKEVSSNKKSLDILTDETDCTSSYKKMCIPLNAVNNDDINKMFDNDCGVSKKRKSENDFPVNCIKSKKLSCPDDTKNIAANTINKQFYDSSNIESHKRFQYDDKIINHESIPNGCESIVKTHDDDFGLIDDVLFEDWGHKEETLIKNRNMNLDKCKRCTVILVNHNYDKNDTKIRIKDYVDSNITDCLLQGSWTNLTLKEGNLVSVLAEWNDDLGWIITNTSGYVVLEPDMLVAGTTLVGSLFCMRRAILSDMFRGLDPNSEVMVIGSLLHEILQEVLKQKLRNRYEIEEVVNKIISTNDFTFTLYSSNISMEKVKKQLDIFIPQILKFISNYIPPITGESDNESWKGEITSIEDIEENIWATNLGLKGKIDVTVKVRSQNRTKVMPLELKTGRASFSSEHRGQVILYSLMMSEIGKDVDSGLLLYLREGVMKEVKAGVMEKRDLILLRNELIQFTNERREIGNITDGIIGAPNLPEPINHLRGCSSCPYLTVCSAAMKESGLDKLPSKNALHGLVFPATDHLKSEHIRFVFHWVGLLQLEDKEVKRSMFSVKDIWNLNPEEREKNRSGLCNLQLEGEVIENEFGKYKHTFIRNEELIDGIITKGDYVIVSSNERVALASGIVFDIATNSCSISLERDLSNYKNLKFHLDRYDSQTILMYNMTNLGYLLEATPECSWLRDKIISLELPVYSRLSLEVLGVGQDLLSKLNKGQKHAVLQALASQHYLLIKGMPGTGKTATLVSLIELLVRLKQSILVTSHTHSAVDNVLRRLPQKVQILRLGSLAKIHPDIHNFSEHNITASTPEELEEIYNSKQVVGVTCLGAGHPLLRRRKFDVVLVDEATQVHLPTTLRPLFAASRFILVGDPKQLPPLVKSRQASDLGLRQSLFSYLDRPSVTAELRTQYRMNKCITDLANGLTYEGKLECANEKVSQATITLQSNKEDYPNWMSLVLSTSLDDSVVVLDCGFDITAKSSSKREVDYVVQMVKMFLKFGIKESQLGIIAPFQAQVALIKNRFKCDKVDVEVSTVDTFQGRDKDIIIYSCTRSGFATEINLLSDQNRMTVAITRARHKLIFIGDVKTLKGYPIFEKLFSLIKASNTIPLTPQNL